MKADQIWADDFKRLMEEQRLTLRDFFAGCALMGMFAAGNVHNDEIGAVGQAIFIIADSAMKARGE